MKTLLLSLTCAALAAAPVSAQVFQPTTARNVLIGGVAGAIIGEHNGHQALEGAAIGAAAGYVWSLATQPSRSYAPPVPVSSSYGYSDCDRPVVVHRPVVVSRPRVIIAPPPVVIYREAPRHHHHGHRDRVIIYKEQHGPRHYHYGHHDRRDHDRRDHGRHDRRDERRRW